MNVFHKTKVEFLFLEDFSRDGDPGGCFSAWRNAEQVSTLLRAL